MHMRKKTLTLLSKQEPLERHIIPARPSDSRIIPLTDQQHDDFETDGQYFYVKNMFKFDSTSIINHDQQFE